LWTVGGGNTLHLIAGIVSVESAGMVQVYQGALERVRLIFDKKGTVPVPIVMGVVFGRDDTLNAKYTGDVGADNGFMTSIGHEY